MWDDLFRAVALLLVIEGMLPFLTPSGWKQAMLQAAGMPERVLRIIGLCSMIAGVLLLYLAK